MDTYTNQTFSHEEVPLDGRHFINCQFQHCKMVFSGGEFIFEGITSFDGCIWELRGQAASTVDFLHNLHIKFPAEAERLFEAIKNGPRENPRPH